MGEPAEIDPGPAPHHCVLRRIRDDRGDSGLDLHTPHTNRLFENTTQRGSLAIVRADRLRSKRSGADMHFFFWYVARDKFSVEVVSLLWISRAACLA
jgi:hypothetical protein